MGMIRRSTSNHFLELLPGPFKAILQGLNANKQAVIGAVKALMQPPHKSKAQTANTINEDDD